jgi:hypothetical protein
MRRGAIRRLKKKKSARTNVLLLKFTSQVALQDEQDQQLIFFLQRQGVGAHLHECGLSGAAIANCTA